MHKDILCDPADGVYILPPDVEIICIMSDTNPREKCLRIIFPSELIINNRTPLASVECVRADIVLQREVIRNTILRTVADLYNGIDNDYMKRISRTLDEADHISKSTSGQSPLSPVHRMLLIRTMVYISAITQQQSTKTSIENGENKCKIDVTLPNVCNLYPFETLYYILLGTSPSILVHVATNIMTIEINTREKTGTTCSDKSDGIIEGKCGIVDGCEKRVRSCDTTPPQWVPTIKKRKLYNKLED